MAGRSAGGISNCPKMFEYQVFLSFMGPDTRIFVGHLYNALQYAGFKVFLDNDGLEDCRDIQLELYKAIDCSEMSVVILSRGYAGSDRCLNELVKIMELEAANVHSVLPVFFDVEPRAVRKQEGVVMSAFKVLEKSYEGEVDRVAKWKSAMKKIANLRGLRLELPKPDSNLFSEHRSSEIPKLIGSVFSFRCPWKPESTLNLMSIKTSSFTMMSNLDLLLLNHVQLSGGFGNFPKKLKWLLWPLCPLQYIPPNFTLDELVVLDMRRSCLVHAWKGSKCMGALRILELSYSLNLECTPDLSHAPMLECLFLKGCVGLVEVHESIGNLRNLVHLNVEGCKNLVRMHKSIETLEKLTILNLKGCTSLLSFPFPSSLNQMNLAECGSYFMGPNQMEQSDICHSSPSKILSFAYPLPRNAVPSTSPYTLYNFYLPLLKELNLTGCGISRDDIFELLICAPAIEFLVLRGNPIRELSNKDMNACLKIKVLNLRHCTKLHTISQLPRSCEVVTVEGCSSLKAISYINGTENIPSPFAVGCKELVEIDYGSSDRLVIKWTHEMDEGQANLFGFSNLDKFVSGSIVADTEDGTESERGFYRAGIYQVYLLGDHLAKWFTTRETVAELHHTVSSYKQEIRAINLGFMLIVENTHFSVHDVRIKNLTGMWEWTLETPSAHHLRKDDWGITITWLSHWCVMEHREIKPGDLLHISVSASGFHDLVRWGIKIIYEQPEDPDGSAAAVAVSYKNTFLHPLPDLSVYESKRLTDIDEDQNHKTSKYVVSRPLSL